MSMKEKRYLTRRDYNKLGEEIILLEARMRSKQAQTGDVADTGGNQWHDNAGYEHLVIELRGLNKQLADLHTARNIATIAPPPSSNEKVLIGTDVVLEMSGEKDAWSIVGYDRGDVDRGLLAYNTPLARQILGARVGETRSVQVGGSKTSVKIVSIAITPGGD